MKLELALHGYAAAGDGSQPLPGTRRIEMQAAGSSRGGGRLPRLALELARLALGSRAVPHEAGVFFGTALGCLTETEAFVANMIRSREATPKPRAFTSSVHNAIASFVALDLGARGECSTFVHGELSFAHALLSAALCARRCAAPLVVGALDEEPRYTFLDLARAAGQEEFGEGGAVFAAGSLQTEPAAWIEDVWLDRPADPLPWARSELRAQPADVLLYTYPGPRTVAQQTASRPALVTSIASHPSSLATATAIAFGLLAGEVEPAYHDLSSRPASVAVLGVSSHGEAALLRLRRR